MIVPYTVPTVTLERQNLAEPVSLRLSEGGRLVHTYLFEGSQLDLDEAPLVFVERADQWWLAAMASCSLDASRVRVRLPPQAAVLSGAAGNFVTDDNGGRWVTSTEDLLIQVGEDQFSIRLNGQRSEGAGLQLIGTVCPYETFPATVYLGKPQLDVSADSGYKRSDLREFENGRLVACAPQHARVGAVRYAVRTTDGETVLLRRFGVLPKDFRIHSQPATNSKPAALLLKQGAHLHCQVLGEGITAISQDTEEGLRLELSHTGDQPPPHVDLELTSPSEREPVRVRVPYPFVGARLFDRNNQISPLRELTTDQLLGTRLVLFSSLPQDFYLLFRLNAGGSNPSRSSIPTSNCSRTARSMS